MKKYIRGTFQLEKDVTDLFEYETLHGEFLRSMIGWGNENNIGIKFGLNSEHTYLCEFCIKTNTKQLCHGYVSELKAMLKKEYPKIKPLYKESGDCIG